MHFSPLSQISSLEHKSELWLMRLDTTIFLYFLESGVTHPVKCVEGFAFKPGAIAKACIVLGVP